MKALNEADHALVIDALELYRERYTESDNLLLKATSLRAEWLRDCLGEGLISLMASADR